MTSENTPNPNRPRQIREHDNVWAVFDDITKRNGTNRNVILNQMIRGYINAHGTPEERATVALADAQMEELRRARGRRKRSDDA